MNSVCDATTEGSGDTRDDAAVAAGADAALADFAPGSSDHCDGGLPAAASLFPLIFSHATATLAAELKLMSVVALGALPCSKLLARCVRALKCTCQ